MPLSLIELLPAAVRRGVAEQLLLRPARGPAVVGVSGGVDSIVLLHLLVQADPRRLVVAHLDHGLRGRSAQADARFVRRTAEKLGLPCVCGSASVKELARVRGDGIEEAGRTARRDFFGTVAARTCSPVLFLGHHADDRVETLLLALLRGTGSTGLSALRADTEQMVGRRSMRVVRPLLTVFRAELESAARAAGLVWREDASNRSRLFRRNAIRHDLLPFLEALTGRDPRRNLLRTAEILAGEDAFLEALLPGGISPDGLSVAVLRGMPVPLARRFIRRWLLESGLADIGFDDIEAVRGLVTNGKPAKINLPADWHARRRNGKIFLEHPAPAISRAGKAAAILSKMPEAL